MGAIVSRAPGSYSMMPPGLAGLGQGIGPGTLNCPGDPGCPGGPSMVPPPPVGDATFWNTWGTIAGQIAGQQLAASPPAVPTGPLAPLSSFLSANPSYLAWGFGLLLLVVLGTQARR